MTSPRAITLLISPRFDSLSDSCSRNHYFDPSFDAIPIDQSQVLALESKPRYNLKVINFYHFSHRILQIELLAIIIRFSLLTVRNNLSLKMSALPRFGKRSRFQILECFDSQMNFLKLFEMKLWIIMKLGLVIFF